MSGPKRRVIRRQEVVETLHLHIHDVKEYISLCQWILSEANAVGSSLSGPFPAEKEDRGFSLSHNDLGWVDCDERES